MPIGPSQQYLAKYNNFVLPGYVQSESFDSAMNIAMHTAPYADGAISEYTGLENKDLTVRLKVWEQDYLTVKNTIETAATYLRSNRSGYAPLYLQYTDRYYDAMVASVRYNKDAGTSVRTGEYEVNFKCRPWLIGDTLYSEVYESSYITGTFSLAAYGVTRTLANNGGWTPLTYHLNYDLGLGDTITISGWNEYGDFTGFISISGVNYAGYYIIDTENYTVKLSNGTNMLHTVNNTDFGLYLGPGNNFWTITGGAYWSRLKWRDRWYL